MSTLSSGAKSEIEWVDSHAHLDRTEFDRDREAVVQRAWDEGIRGLLCPAEMTEAPSPAVVLELAEKYPWIIAAAGVHPHQAGELAAAHLDRIKELAGSQKIKAVGEIGLDYHYNLSPPERQKEAFRAQLCLAQQLRLPVIVHSRKSGKDIIAGVKEEHFEQGGVLHCFTEDWETARSMMDCHFSISFSGILTFGNALSLREIAKKIPLDRLLIETDSPYLVPVPWRGKKARNEPSLVIETARVLAELKNIPLGELAGRVLQNYRALFGV